MHRHHLMDSPDEPSVAKASYRYPDWVMLDPHTRLNYPVPTIDSDYPMEDFHATKAHAETSMGDPIDVFFRAVPPPGASRLYVNWTPRRFTKGSSSSSGAGRGEDRWDGFYGREPLVLAANGNSILLRLTLSNTLVDFFVYTVHSTGAPSLLRLPDCKLRFSNSCLRSGGLDHMVTLGNIGFLCDAESEEFVVADLMILPKHDDASHHDDTPVVAGLCIFRSCSPGEDWKASKPRICHKKGQGRELIWWHTDVVVPHGVSLCYIDYFRGILFLDILRKCPRLLYVRLPLMNPVGDPYDSETGRGCPSAFRSVCVTNGGTMKFVEVVTRTVFLSGSQSAAASSFAIKVWRLREHDMTWEKESTIQDTELWSLQGYGDLLRVPPTFPVVSMTKPDVIFCVLSNGRFGDANVTWVIVIDMLKKTLRSAFRYKKVHRNSIENDGNMASASLSTNRAFIPSQLSKYLGVTGARRKRRNLG
ncbi:hypothetical protein ACQJBY_068241 [Aegilops geniculata]